jgi:hypothetical protein
MRSKSKSIDYTQIYPLSKWIVIMPSTSAQLAVLLAEIYSSSSKSASAITYAAQNQKTVPVEKRVAYLGKTVSNTTQAVTHALVAAGLNGAKGLAEASLTASGLSLICSLPSAIDALSSLGLTKSGVSTKELYERAEGKTELAIKDLKTSLLVTGPTKHDNIARLLFNLPLDTIQDKAHHNLFPAIKKELIQQKRGDAIKFYKKWLVSDEKRQELIDSFNAALDTYDNPNMKAPIASLGEVAALLSLLDPDKDQNEVQALSLLFKDMLTQYRLTLSKDIDSASALDEGNRVLLNLMVSSYTGRANRKKIQAKNLKIGKHILTGMGVVLSAALAIHTAGLSIPATALLVGKISSTSVSVLSTATRVAQMVKEGHAAEEIASLLSPEVINTLGNTTMAAELLDKTKESSEAFDKSLQTLIRKIRSLNRATYHDIIDIKKKPLYILRQLEKEETLLDILHDEKFIGSIEKKIEKGISASDIYRLMISEVDAIKALPGTQAFSIKRGKLEMINVVISYLMHSDKVVRGTLVDCAKKGEAALFLKGWFEKHREKALGLHQEKNILEGKIAGLEQLEKNIDKRKRLLHMSIGLYNHQPTPHSATGKLLKANLYIESVEQAQELVSDAMEETKKLLVELETGRSEKTNISFSTSV